MPELAGFFGVVFELLFIAANADEFFAVEADGGGVGGLDCEEGEVDALVLELVDGEVDAGVEEAEEPVFEFFVALFGLFGAEGGADGFVGGVLDAPDDIAGGFAVEGRAVRDGGEVLADFLGFGAT